MNLQLRGQHRIFTVIPYLFPIGTPIRRKDKKIYHTEAGRNEILLNPKIMLNLLFTKTKIMDQKTAGIVTYLTLIGWIVVMVTHKEKTEYIRFHLRQMLGIMLLMVVISFGGAILASIIPGIGFIFNLLNLAPVILWVIGLVGALNEEEKLVPIFGENFQEWFKSV